MKPFETTAIVEELGQIHVADLPFAPGTQVQIAIKPVQNGRHTPADDLALTAARDRMRELFRTVKGFRNSPRIPREELYQR